jgi:hypothetical protein
MKKYILRLEVEVTTIREQKNQNNNKETWRSIGLYSFMSLNLGLMIAGGYYLGRFLERNFHLKNMTITGVFIGLFFGLYEMFKIAYKAGQKK